MGTDAEQSKTTCNPVYLKYGASVESVMDLAISGPAFSWSLNRSYASNGTGTSKLGNKWHCDAGDVYLTGDGDTTVNVFATASSRIGFADSNGGGDNFQPSRTTTNLRVTKNTSNGQYYVKDNRSNLVYRFPPPGGGGNTAGKPSEYTTRHWSNGALTGTTYSYDTNGKLNQITTAEGQDYDVTLTYNTGGFITKVEVKDSSANLLQQVDYTYYQDVTSASSDLGTTNDLVQVKVSKRATKDTTSLSIVRYTQYRYDGTTSRLKTVYEHDAIQRTMSALSLGTPEIMMQKADTYGTPSVQSFASKSFEYYTADTATSSINTPFATGENLNSLYGGSESAENGFVKAETVGGCGSCGTSGSVKKSYFYMTLSGTANQNKVSQIIVEDKSDSTGAAISRTVYGLEDSGRQLRKALIQNPTGTPSYWCESWKMATSGQDFRLAERRYPSAHNVTSASAFRNFLNPYDGSSWSNDTNTLNTSEGLIEAFSYDSTTGLMLQSRTKKGSSGTEYITRQRDFGEGLSLNSYLQTGERSYPTKTTTAGDGIKISYSYTFWDSDEQLIKTKTTTYPAVSTSQNGSGATWTTVEYFDSYGRLRWTKDGEGYINYYSYNPITGGIAYQSMDVDPSSPGSEATSGSSGNWDAWTFGDANSNKPTRDSGLPTPLAYVTKRYYDSQGRPTRVTDRTGANHYVAYENNRMIVFPYWDSTNSKCLVPIRVRSMNSGAQISDEIAIKASYTSISTSSGTPTGFSTEPTQSDYVELTKYTYDSVNGRLKYTDRFANIPSSGVGTLSTDYYRSVTQYDTQGRVQYEIDVVAGSGSTDRVEQVTQNIYDIRDRILEIKSGVSGDSAANSHNMTDDYNSYPTLRSLVQLEFDEGGIGDGLVTKLKRFFGTGTNDYTGVNFQRTYRGHVRGVEPYYMNGSTETPIGPYRVNDFDWNGLPTTSALYDTAPTWSSVLTGDGYTAYAASTATNRRTRRDMLFDDLGRVYQSKLYKIDSTNGSGSDYFSSLFYYDRSNRVVAYKQEDASGVEMAYDGVGRRYQYRIVNSLATTSYSSGKYQYRSPTPHPSLSSMTGGDDGLLTFGHVEFDSVGRMIGQHTFDAGHDDVNGSSIGIDMSNNDDYIRSTAYRWYDAANRPTATASYGSGDTTTGAGVWKYTTVPTRPSSAPSSSSDTALVTSYSYHSDTGIADVITDPAGKKSKGFHDRLKRIAYWVENWDDFAGSAETGSGDSTDKSKDRVTKQYLDAYGNIRKLVAFDQNGDGSLSDNQTTNYLFEDPVNAALVTSEIYPDSSDTSSSGTDQIKFAFNVDGSISQQTDQLGTVLSYDYTNIQQLESVSATTLGTNVDGSVRSIKYTYDNLRRLTNTTSYSGTAGAGSVINDVQSGYNDFSQLTSVYQSHSGSVSTSTSAKVQYAYDTTVSGNVFTNRHRLQSMIYPNGRAVFYDYDESTSTSPYHRLSDVRRIRETNSTGAELAVYDRMGSGRPMIVDLPEPDLKLDYFQGTSGTYAGVDRFSRIKDQYWDGYGSTSDADRILSTYDYAGSRTSRDVDSAIYATNDRDQAYTYDGLRRLKTSKQGTLSSGSISGTPAKEKSWTLDALGNWSGYVTKTSGTTDLNQSRAVNAANEITDITESTGASWSTPSYDAAGNMTSIPKPNDPTGSYTATYDAWNRLVKLQDGSNTVAEYAYDGRDFRTVQKSYSGGTLSETRHFYYGPNWRTVEERTGTTPDTASADRQFVWGTRYVDDLVLRDRDTDANGTLDERLYALQDANWNVTGVVNTSGAVQERYGYTAYGEPQFLTASFGNQSSSTVDWETLYGGYRYDKGTGLYSVRYRYLHSTLGLWINRDPVSFADSMNLAEYVGSAPTRYLDPSGLTWEEYFYGVGQVSAGMYFGAGAALYDTSVFGYNAITNPVGTGEQVINGAVEGVVNTYEWGTVKGSQYYADPVGQLQEDYDWTVETANKSYNDTLDNLYESGYSAGYALEKFGEGGVAAKALCVVKTKIPLKKKTSSPSAPKSPATAKPPVAGLDDAFGLTRAEREKLVSKRPVRYRKGVVEKVWENAKNAEGKVIDPNTLEELTWDLVKNRDGQWDMGHIKGKSYDQLKQDFLEGRISRKQFLDEYNNPANYRPEGQSPNRSRRYD